MEGSSLDRKKTSRRTTSKRGVLLQDLERSSQPVTPFGFLMQLREKFPQFAQQRNGLYMQQDAEECCTQLLYSLRERLKVLPRRPSALLHCTPICTL